MLSLLRGEWYQVRKAISVKIALLVTAIISVAWGIQTSSASYLEEYHATEQAYLLYGGGTLCSTMSDAASVALIASLFAGIFISAAFENRTVPSAISYGKGRKKVYLAKMMMFHVVVMSISLVYWMGCSVVAFLRHGLGTPQEVGNLCRMEYIVGMVFAAVIAYASLAAVCGLIGFLNRKTGATIGICFTAILFGGNLLPMFLPERMIKLLEYTPLRLYQQVLKMDVSWGDMIRVSCISAVWIVVVCGLGLWSFQRTELK